MIWTFKEVFSVASDLRQKIITAVEKKYITVLHDLSTNSIKNTIDTILNNIFDTYSKITPMILNQREDVVKQMTFDVDRAIDTVLKNVE